MLNNIINLYQSNFNKASDKENLRLMKNYSRLTSFIKIIHMNYTFLKNCYILNTFLCISIVNMYQNICMNIIINYKLIKL